ncbi:pectinesterase family protein [Paenibacillus provencensis]|uniref:Pectinesterase n=1 Tax=Paenibacillus provencensis TaxID=441151 RepID=A0ABW3PIS0_9BACL|nr:pectinesterase family protein [Paenibacillus sp. MER 78]MCM3126894.1 pectinesterase family protein [Paenibacillus sp. MER 78]
MIEITVAQDGTADFNSIQEAIDQILSLRAGSSESCTIFIKSGIYQEKIHLNQPGVRLIGENAEDTIITYGDYAHKLFPDGSPYHTFNTYTVLISSDDVSVSHLTIENSAGYGKEIGQAIAAYVDGDRVSFYHCRLLGHQDTLFTGPLPEAPINRGRFGGPRDMFPRRPVRQYYECCYIEGDVDFIFGSATAVFVDCELFSKRRHVNENGSADGTASPGYITAASTAEEVTFGYVFWDCSLTGNADSGSVYLGRPWREYAKTVFVNCDLGKHIHPAGWHNWGKREREQTVEYAEYGSHGPGAEGERVEWTKRIEPEMLHTYSPAEVLKGNDSWNPIRDKS